MSIKYLPEIHDALLAFDVVSSEPQNFEFVQKIEVLNLLNLIVVQSQNLFI